MKVKVNNFLRGRQKGFTLVEIVLVTAIIGLFSVLLLIKFRSAESNQVMLAREAQMIISDIRRAQTLAIAGYQVSGQTVCGFGIARPNENPKNTRYWFYAGKASAGSDCESAEQRYKDSGSEIDILMQNINIRNSKIQIGNSYPDIFFEVPGSKVYFNNSEADYDDSQDLRLEIIGLSCPANCKTIRIWGTGKIDLL